MIKKKILALALALTLTTGLGATAFAAERNVTSLPDTVNIPVQGKYVGQDGEGQPVDPGDIEKVYSVDVEWGEMKFTYTVTGDMTWNPTTHEYEGTGSAAWTAVGDTVTVTNHSNAPVQVDFAFEKDAGIVGNFTGSMTVGTDTLDAGVENKPLEADSVTSQLVLDGSLGVDNTVDTPLGNVNVTLTAIQ